jgi:hypothetical protein
VSRTVDKGQIILGKLFAGVTLNHLANVWSAKTNLPSVFSQTLGKEILYQVLQKHTAKRHTQQAEVNSRQEDGMETLPSAQNTR